MCLSRTLLFALALATHGCAAASPGAIRASVAAGRVAVDERPSPPVLARIAWYVPNRLADVLDLISVELRAGPEAGAKLVLTRAIALGATPSEHAYALGFHGREAGVHRADTAGESIVGWRHRADLLMTREPILGSVEPVAYGRGALLSTGTAIATPGDPDPARDGLLDIESGGSLALVGYDVKVRAGEIPDLILGLFLLDPSGDDWPRPERVRLEGTGPDLARASPEIAALLRERKVPAGAAARPLECWASGDGIVRLAVALESKDGKPLGRLDIVRKDGRLVPLDARTRLERPWLR